MPVLTESTEKSKFQVFGDVDRGKDGKVKSQYPSWYFTTQKEELKESIRHKEYSIENDLVPASEKNITRERLNQEKKKLTAIEASMPNPSGPELDEISKIVTSLGKKVSETMFKRSDMDRGIADAHEEARRVSTPCIKLEDKEIGFVKACDVSITHDGKVSRDGAAKAWKIGRRLLGEMSNVEILRRA